MWTITGQGAGFNTDPNPIVLRNLCKGAQKPETISWKGHFVSGKVLSLWQPYYIFCLCILIYQVSTKQLITKKKKQSADVRLLAVVENYLNDVKYNTVFDY